MCRNIRPLFNFAPPATPDELRDASLQFVRKVSGFHHPSKANQAAFEQAVVEVTGVIQRLLDGLVTNAEPRDREVERARAKARAVKRFARAP
ncbi:MAG TPA: DUF2277 domain-containing protein [Gemmatimonadales bacterium]|nr:DUF2277 domain-containing protein [Gemmatimonadales bacterium]